MSNEHWTHLLERIENIEKEIKNIKQAVQNEIQEDTIVHAEEKAGFPVIQKGKLVQVVPEEMKKENKGASKKIEVELGQKWLPRVFLFVLIIGFIWGFVAAVEEGWITEPVRILIGFAVGTLLYILGEKQIKEERKNLGVTLLAGTVILFILTTFAMNVLYGYIGFWAAFFLYVLWIVLGLFFSYQHRSQTLGVLVSIGGYFVPFLIDGAQDQNALLFYLYETFLYGGYLIYAMKKGYKVLHYVSFLFLHLVTVMYSNINFEETIYPIMMFWLQHFLLLYVFFIRGNMKKKHVYSTLLSSFFLNVAWMNEYWNDGQTQFTLLVLALVYIVSSILTWKEKDEKRALALTLATTAIGVFSLYTFSEDYIKTIYILEGMAAIYFAKTIKDKLQWAIGLFVLTAGIMMTFGRIITEWWSPEMLSYLVSLGSLILLFLWRKDEFHLSIPKYKPISVVLLSAFSLLFITQVAELIFKEFDSVTKAIAVSVSWLMYAILFIVIGKWKDLSSYNIFGIVMLFSVLLKVIFVDLSISSVAVKAVLFVVLGAVGLIISRFFYQNEKTKKE